MILKPKYFLGADVGGTKTRLAVSDQGGRILGLGLVGAGNHELVGYGGLALVLQQALQLAMPEGVRVEEIAGAGFGVGGLDFPSETEETLRAIAALGLRCPVEAVNDAVIGLVAGSPDGWGIAVVSGTGCNCRGRDASGSRSGRVTGRGTAMGEGAGASELIDETVKTLARMWTGRIPLTDLAWVFTEYCGAASLEELVEWLAVGRCRIGPEAAPLIFQAADQGDPAAAELVEWAGRELGELAAAVIRQLEFQRLAFDVVLSGSMFVGGARLVDPMTRTILQTAPGARLMRLATPPVVGAVLLGMEAAGAPTGMDIRANLAKSIQLFLKE
jgi:N-acetylglucosamine kinase-like BadF-type ATPase